MAQYIDKDTLVSEIESKIEKYTKRGEESDAKHDGYGMYWGGVLSCLNEVRTLCDSLEVKEVDDVRHDASETPKGAGDKEILVQFTDYHTSVLEIDDWEYLDHQTKWAYLKDLT